MNRQVVFAIAAGIALLALLVYAGQDRPDTDEQELSEEQTTEQSTRVAGWDDVEDGAEDIGGAIERQWERVEDAVIPETEEERREEAQERREDAAEEAAEERRKR